MTDQTIEKLTIDEVDFVVAELPEEIQGAVRKYEEWRERQLIATDEVQLVSAALRDLGAQIVAAIRVNEEQLATAAAEAEAAVAEAAEAAVAAKVAAKVLELEKAEQQADKSVEEFVASAKLPEPPEDDDGEELLVVED